MHVVPHNLVFEVVLFFPRTYGLVLMLLVERVVLYDVLLLPQINLLVSVKAVILLPLLMCQSDNTMVDGRRGNAMTNFPC
jgi:hypothetical protein